MQETTVFWLLAIIAVLITGISKSGFAGGIGVIAVPLMALQIGPLRAAAIMLPLLIFMDILSVKAWWGKQRNDLLRLLLPPAITGIVLGYLLYDFFDEQILMLSLGIMSVVFSLWGLLQGIKLDTAGHPWIGRICALVAGLTSFIAHAGGPPLNFYLLPLKLSKEDFLATAVYFFTAINLVKLLPYMVLGQINTDNLLIGAMLAPVAWLGVKLGLVIQKKINQALFMRIILSMLLIIGIKLIASGWPV
ncbi:MAG: sulfite exporter TauE/SafE family protein [Oceanospirillaceae bacterium]|nr:sulfite exporter TauE/SafE family protein [Oceanospirillaceae bacterium]